MTFKKEDYYDIEKRFYESLISLISDNILLYCVTGSLGRNDIIVGWSDIDILLVIDKYDKNILTNINKCIQDNSIIKIGVTIFSVEEFNDKYFKDPKTYISVKMILDGNYKPRIIKPEVNLVLADALFKNYMDISSFSNFSHEIKRELIKMPHNYDERKVYKLIIVLLKIMLYQKNIIALSYNDVLLFSSKYIKNFNIKFPSPENILNDPKNKEERYIIYLNFLEWLRKNTYVIFQ